MNAMQSFFMMGGYAAYVWPAYAVFFIVLIADTLSPRLRRRRLLGELRARVARQSARQERDTASTPPSSTPPSA
ncbi:heme exporter protein CcmD [Rhodanobacter sp. B05]|jgi:heme exporter protein D|uniref:heme exporter protein CcmD n=1 Tax=Rhodanobacter sp. B05 TaxID=1945859 RepID=UPI0009855BD4|nr:heme exporter protein CcmD [Rhodanobacter sp. B05]OOG58260.1 heme exporter protein CcmD [Rhodanobacter sp. B05]